MVMSLWPRFLAHPVGSVRDDIILWTKRNSYDQTAYLKRELNSYVEVS